MPVIPLAATSALFEGGMQLVVAIYREVATSQIIEKANGKYDEGIKVLEDYHALMTPDQIEQIAVMGQRVEAARPPQPSQPTTLRDLLRNPFNKITVARKYKRICKEYLHLVQRMSQLARLQAAERDVLFALSEKNGMLSQALGPVIEASQVFDVSQAVALEIERAAGPGAEMTVKFRDVKLSVGASTSMSLQFTPSGIFTVSLGLIQVPSLAQREDGAAPMPAASGESAQAETAVGGKNVPHLTTPQPNALGRTPSVISLSGTATIFPRQKNQGDLHSGNPDACPGKNVDAVNKANVHGEDSGGRVSYALRFDNLEYHAEVDATPTKDDTVV